MEVGGGGALEGGCAWPRPPALTRFAASLKTFLRARTCEPSVVPFILTFPLAVPFWLGVQCADAPSSWVMWEWFAEPFVLRAAFPLSSAGKGQLVSLK